MENNVTPNTEKNTENNTHCCKYCGNPLNDNYRVCLHCGAPNESLYVTTSNESDSSSPNDNNHFSPALIVGLILSIFNPYLSLIIGIYSLTSYLKVRKENRSKQWKSDFILTIVLIAMSLTMAIYVFIAAQNEIVEPDEEKVAILNCLIYK